MTPWGMALVLPLLAAPAARTGASDAPVWQKGSATYFKPNSQADDVAIAEVKRLAADDAVGRVYGRTLDRALGKLTTVRNHRMDTFIYRKLSMTANGVVVNVRNESRVERKDVPDPKGNLRLSRFSYSAEFLVRPAPSPDPTYRIDLHLANDSLYAGDPVRFEVAVNKPSKLMVFSLAADNQVYFVYPNAYAPPLEATPERTLTVPGEGDAFELRPYNLPGHQHDDEVLWVVATQSAVAPPSATEGRMSVIAFMAWLHALPRDAWTSAQQPYSVLARRKEGL